jgi:hypothetical protein
LNFFERAATRDYKSEACVRQLERDAEAYAACAPGHQNYFSLMGHLQSFLAG